MAFMYIFLSCDSKAPFSTAITTLQFIKKTFLYVIHKNPNVLEKCLNMKNLMKCGNGSTVSFSVYDVLSALAFLCTFWYLPFI